MMAARLAVLGLGLAILTVCAAGASSTTVVTGPEGQRWDAQALVGECIQGQQGSGWTRVVEASCTDPGAVRVLNVVNDHRDCHPDTSFTHLWPAQGPDPNVVVCAG